MHKTNKIIEARLKTICALCERAINVIIYPKGYRGGHYFGKVPLYTKKALAEAIKGGYRKSRIPDANFQVMKKSPKAYKYLEYWECPKCYWGK